MSGLTIFITIVAAGAALAWMIAPLLFASEEERQAKRQDAERERLLVLYEQVLRSVRDLDDDYALGKMPQAEYKLERDEWMARGVQILELLGDEPEAVQEAVEDVEEPQEAPHVTTPDDIDAAIEAAVSRAMARSS
jgi:hypothetical protein